MNIRLGYVLSLGLVVGVAMSAAPLARAQQQKMESHGPSNYVYVENIAVKPGMSDAYAKAIETWNEDRRAAEDPWHTLGMVPITGSRKTMFISGFESFEQAQKWHDEMMANKKLQGEIEGSEESVGAMIRNESSCIYRYRKSLSLHTEDVKLEDMRFMEVDVFHIRAGQDKTFQSMVKVYVKAMASEPQRQWAVYQLMYGKSRGNVYILFFPMKSLEHVDWMMANRKAAMKEVGKSEITLMMVAGKKAIKSETDNLYAFSPQLSYVQESWMKDSPDFWGKK